MSKSPTTATASSWTVEETDVKPRNRVATVMDRYAALWTAAVLILIVAILTIIAPEFLSRGTWLAVSVAAVPILLAALGQTYVIGGGGIDLSVGAVIGLSGMTAGWTMASLTRNGTDPTLAITAGVVVALATGLIAGAVNGVVVTRMKIEPLIATLGMMGVAQGLAYLIGGGNPIGGLPTQLSNIGFTNLFGWIPVPVLVAAVIAVVLGYVLTRTRFGRRTLAIGSSSQAAERAGINTNWHLARIYALSGLLGGIAGVLLITRLSVAAPAAGIGVELSSITAAVIGGTALIGGKASVSGTVLGTLIIAVLSSGLVVAGVDPFWQQVAIGAILVVAVWVDRKRNALRGRAR
jgi:ribose transport system permease protein